jgi:hypothetical protein
MGIILLLVMVLPVISFAQTQPASASAAQSEEWKLKWGGAERLRNEFWRNWKDMNDVGLDNRNFFRIKTSLWGQADYEKDLTLYGRLANEFRAHTYFGGTSPSFPDKTSSKKGYRFDINEVVVDNLYLDVKNFMGAAVDLRLGRQDFLGTYGEGFLIMDGTPGDGSRTFYFNAAKASWRVNEENTLDLIYINNPRDEEFLPVINRVKFEQQSNRNLDKIPFNLNTTDEEGYVLYLKNKSIKDLALEAYYIYKKEAEEGGGTSFQSQKGKINTIGSFAKYSMAPCTLRGQLAYQFGDYGTVDREGIGGYAFIDHDFKDVLWKPQASLGFVYLSGDNRKTAKNEAWDPLFSRYPWMSELYLLSLGAETGVSGYWTNVEILRASVSFKPTEKAKVSIWYNYLRANAQVAAGTIFSGNKKERGHMPQVKLDYAFNKDVTAYFLAEYLLPKKFYVNKDPALFLRTEVQIKF